MRSAFQMRRWALALAICLQATAFCAIWPLKAAAFNIDPDPASPTLGDLLDREGRAAKRERTAPVVNPRQNTAPPESPRPRGSSPQPRSNLPPRAPDGDMRNPAGNAKADPSPGQQTDATVSLPPLRTISAVPHVPRNASTVNVRRAIARPRNAPVLPAIPPLEGDAAITGSIGDDAQPLPSGADAILPPRRPEARIIAANPLRSPADSRLLREPQHTHGVPVGANGDVRSRVSQSPAGRSADIADSSGPGGLPLRSEMKSAAQNQPRRIQMRSDQMPLPRTDMALVATSSRQAETRVALPPLEEPPRVAPRPRLPDPALQRFSAAAEPTPAKVTEPAAPVDADRFVYVVDQDLRQFLTDFARRVGLRADVAANVRGRLTRVKLPLEPQPLLRDLEKRFDLEWLIEGEILKVASRSDLATRILPLGPVQYEDLIREMRALDIDVTRYPLKRLSESNALIVTAPAAYLGRVSALIETLRAGKTVGPDLRIVRSGVTRKVEWE